MTKELEELIRSLNNGKIYGIHTKLAKLFKISDVAVNNWFRGYSKPSKENISKLAKLTGKKEEEIKNIVGHSNTKITEDIYYHSSNKQNITSISNTEMPLKIK